MKNLLLGCPFDNGIRSMLIFRRGITGAARGPGAILEAFQKNFGSKYSKNLTMEMMALEEFNLPFSPSQIAQAEFQKNQLFSTLQAHERITNRVKQAWKEGYRPIGIGGDHSLSYPLCRGMARANPGKKIGVINIDAHFDMRPLEQCGEVRGIISSGNSFRRMLEDPELNLSGEDMAVVGLYDSASEIFHQLRDYAHSRGVKMVLDSEIKDVEEIAHSVIKRVAARTDFLYLSVDIDCLKEVYAPGVSSPAPRGLEERLLYGLVQKIAAHPKVWAFDVMETSDREVAWFELLEGKHREETSEERRAKLEKTALQSARLIDLFLEQKSC